MEIDESNLEIVYNKPFIGQYKIKNNKNIIGFIHLDSDGSLELSFMSHRFKTRSLLKIINFVERWAETLDRSKEME
jgi:hypothetical protein